MLSMLKAQPAVSAVRNAQPSLSPHRHTRSTPRHTTGVLEANEDAVVGRVKRDRAAARDENPECRSLPTVDLRRHGAGKRRKAHAGGRVRLAKRDAHRETAAAYVRRSGDSGADSDVHRRHCERARSRGPWDVHNPGIAARSQCHDVGNRAH